MTEQQTPDLAKSDEGAGSGRFAVYDTTYLKFVGGVVDSKSKANKIAKDEGLKPGAFEIREV